MIALIHQACLVDRDTVHHVELLPNAEPHYRH